MNPLNKMLSDVLGKMDEKVFKAKLNSALDMLKNGETEELAKKIGKMDQDELLQKVNEFDLSKLSELKINTEEIKQKITDTDLENLSKMIGENGDNIVKKIKDIIK